MKRILLIIVAILCSTAVYAVDYANVGLAVDISKYIAEDVKKGDTSMQDFINSLPKAMLDEVNGFADGGMYYLPGATTGPVYFYNKTLFDELGLNPPTNWEELESVCKKIYEAIAKRRILRYNKK